MPDPVSAAGPFGSLFTVADGRLHGPSPGQAGQSSSLKEANALVMLNRLAFFDVRAGKLDDGGKRALLRWACEGKLGQSPHLVSAVSRRREAALRALGGPVRCRVRLRVRPEWRLAVGLASQVNAHEISLALHGTYGWPVIPGSALKGLAAAWAMSPDSKAESGDVERVLGGPRPGAGWPGASQPGAVVRPGGDGPAAAMGSVRFLDAMPDGRPAAVLADVMTPHVKPYYDSMAAPSQEPVPPAEYHNPVPLTFLTVRGDYAADLYGTDEKDLDLAAEWLMRAGDEFGAGAKTAAGYGYLETRRMPGAS